MEGVNSQVMPVTVSTHVVRVCLQSNHLALASISVFVQNYLSTIQIRQLAVSLFENMARKVSNTFYHQRVSNTKDPINFSDTDEGLVNCLDPKTG